MKAILRTLAPKQALWLYHFLLAFFSAMMTGFPARGMTVILVTGTKGKSTTTELLYAILKKHGVRVALLNTIRFALPEEEIRNTLKMTMPGRGKIHFLLKKAREQGATHAIIESSSEGTLQSRHLFLSPDVLVFTNLQKEHIEAHGSFEKYKQAKLSIAREVGRSSKKRRAVVAYGNDPHAKDFLDFSPERITFSEDELRNLSLSATNVSFAYKDAEFSLALPGLYNALNALGAIKTCEWLSVPLSTCADGLREVKRVRGRAERVDAGQSFSVLVDYAHTPDSLEALYGAFPNARKICVLGNTGGGRDAWKRPLMASIAEKHCDIVILTNEDPYDEDPRAIIDAMVGGMNTKPTIIMDRREAIRKALVEAGENDVVLITGKGTDPYIMEANGKKVPWDDATVAREELAKLLRSP